MTEQTRVAIVTGAGSGIGREVALTLIENDYSVVLAGRREQMLEETARSPRAAKKPPLIVATDVAQPASVSALFARTQEAFGRLDLLFNNAGGAAPAVPLDELSVEHWQSVINVTLGGAFLCTREAFRMMKQQRPRGGRIINNGSLAAYVPRPHSAPYTAAKHGITGLTKSTSLDGRAFDIACGQIDIGNAATDMTLPMQQGVLQANGSIAIEPTIDPTYVARAVVYMAGLPLDANVQFMTVMATKMPYIGRG